jgi:small-conductance mechanosensitive channel
MSPTKFPFSLYNLIDFEFYLFLTLFSILSYLFYRLLLKNTTPSRHQIIKGHLKNLSIHFIILSIFYLLFIFSTELPVIPLLLTKFRTYIAFLTFFWGCLYFVKVSRLIVLQYLFRGSMRVGVPLLLVNIFSLLLSVVVLFWAVSQIFAVKITPILATSAAFSIVLGLALQDTLGNLFAGISMQIDKTFEIDDWLEVQNGSSKVVGQVKELSWRSTMLIGFSDEMITLPNKLISTAQISNFSLDYGPILRSQMIRLNHTVNFESVKKLLTDTVRKIPAIRPYPEPFTYILEVNENWIILKIIYYIDNYGQQFLIGDMVLDNSLKVLRENNIDLAHQIIEYKKGSL